MMSPDSNKQERRFITDHPQTNDQFRCNQMLANGGDLLMHNIPAYQLSVH